MVSFLRDPKDLEGLVDWRPGLPDSETQALLAGARALLMPSLLEGFGFPVGEAWRLEPR